VEQQCRMMEQELAQNARRAGQRVTAEDFAKVHDRVHVDAGKKVRAGLLMAAIAKKLELKVTDQDVQKALDELAAESGKNIAKVRAEYSDPQRRQILIGMIIEDRVLDTIEGKAKIRVGEAPAATPAAEASEEDTAKPEGASKKKTKK
jgi:trigger factor